MRYLRIILIISITLNLCYQISSAQRATCPSNFEKAEQDLKAYLSSEKNIDKLKQKHNLVLSDTTFNTIHPMVDDTHNDVCSRLLENAPWLKNFSQYSFYKTKNYYFIVVYSLPNNTFNRESIEIFDREYERIVTIMDF